MKKNAAVLVGIFCLIWYFNWCTPLICDDYVYSFIWQDKIMGIALPETAEKISGITDIIYSQWQHYFSWGGRTVAHSLAQFFLWQGKDLFNIFNAACFVLLLLEMQWLIDRGRIHFRFLPSDILWIFGVFWIFSVYLGDIFTWLTLSCNYLWTTVILLSFLLVYVRFYFNLEDIFFVRNTTAGKILLFLFGVLAGWTNENVPCFVILFLGVYLMQCHKQKKLVSILLFGFAGFTLGYLLLMSSPGNYVRYLRQVQDGIVVPGLSLIESNFSVLTSIFVIRFLLLFYVLDNLYLFYRKGLQDIDKKPYYLALSFFLLNIFSLVFMLISPYFRHRSGFPALIFLIISAGIIRALKKSEKPQVKRLNERIEYVFRVAGFFYVFMTIAASIYVWQLQYQQTKIMLAKIEDEKHNPSENVLVVRERPDLLEKDIGFAFAITGGHVIYPYSLTPDEKSWINRDVALYYGITALRAEQEVNNENDNSFDSLLQ